MTDDDIKARLQLLHDEGNHRQTPRDAHPGVLNFSTNDYLGLGADAELQARFFADPSSLRIPMTASAARLLAPRQIEYANMELFLRLLYEKRRQGAPTGVLLYNSGYHANTGILPALAPKGTLVVADRLVHASIIDGIVLSRAPFERFPHNDYRRLEKLLAERAADYARVWVAVESVYSMDGDRADIGALLALKRRYPNVSLYVDEAHAFGCLGPRGLGLVAASEAPQDVDVVVGTFGKAAASAGAFAVTSEIVRDYLVNTSRSFIFSTALPPMQVAWTRYTLQQVLTDDVGRERLHALGLRLRDILQPYSPVALEPSYILPLIVGSSQRALEVSRQLLNGFGIKALPIRRPTVPPGTERLRFSLSATMPDEALDRLQEGLATIMPAIEAKG